MRFCASEGQIFINAEAIITTENFKDIVGLSACFNKIKIHQKMPSLLRRHISHLIAYKVLYLIVCLVFKISLEICHITQGHF